MELLKSELMNCPKCGREGVERHATDYHLCVECVKAENNRLTYYRQHQEDWVEIAKESGLELWRQQPGETQWEYTVWSSYRDSYPGKKPSYSVVARDIGTTHNVVKKIAMRWTFPIRMQAWVRHIDDVTLEQRREQAINMNARHISLAEKINEKIAEGLSYLDASTLRPGEIASLMKTAAELERKARIDMDLQEEQMREIGVDTSAKAGRKQAKADDMSEIVQILAAAGALEGLVMTTTTTTELKVDNSIEIESEVIDE